MVDMLVLFLDVDGVLNTFDPFCRDIQKHFVDRVINIVKATGCKIVLSSTWKFSEKLLAEFQRDVVDRLPQNTYIGYTPLIIPQVKRQEEIKLWLKEHPEIKHWVVLDDYDFELKDLVDHCVITDELYGLTEEKMNEVISKFKEV